MPKYAVDKISNEILTRIEWMEAQLLNWGFVQVESDLDNDYFDKILNELPPLCKRNGNRHRQVELQEIKS